MAWIETLMCDGCGEIVPFERGSTRVEIEHAAECRKWKRRVRDGNWYCPTCVFAVASGSGYKGLVAPSKYRKEHVHADDRD